MNPWKNIASLSKDEIRSLQNRKLHQFINQYLYPFSPYYKRLFDSNKIDPAQIRTIEDLKNIPSISKQNFIDASGQTSNPLDYILQPDEKKIRQSWPASKLIPLALNKIIKGPEFVKDALEREFRPNFITFTGGTTNRPISFVYTEHDIKNLYVSGSRMLDIFKIERTEKIVNMFPYAPHLAFWQVVFGGLASAYFILSTGGGKVMGTEGNIKVLLQVRPSVILGVPSYVYHVIRTAREKGLRLDSIKKVILGADKVTEAFKARLRSELAAMGSKDVFVFGTYGFTEARCAWAECPTAPGVSSGYHLYPDKEIFEIVDPKTGEVKKEGEDGEIVYTSLDSRGSSVVRYRTGDFVKGGVTYEPCPYCGLRVGRLSSDITRISNVKDFNLSKVKGQLVNLNHFDQTLTAFDQIKEWQIELRKKNNDPFDVDEVVFYICVKEKTDKIQLEKDIKKSILVATEVTPNEVIFVSFDEIVNRLELETASKEKRILDKRPKS
ncbi:MAG: hypothetical protein A2Z88_05755 [Omnitrophica WOR_2 bacterium GWA2_47_8]|nr:MAG: hypothetical protein A2Z88_05755 [Omnitrophica WOR_2 bacterium GWA2_47_8]